MAASLSIEVADPSPFTITTSTWYRKYDVIEVVQDESNPCKRGVFTVTSRFVKLASSSNGAKRGEPPPPPTTTTTTEGRYGQDRGFSTKEPIGTWVVDGDGDVEGD